MYLTKLAKLETDLRTKALQVRDEDKADDLNIMANKIKSLREYFSGYGVTNRSMSSERNAFSNRGSSLSSRYSSTNGLNNGLSGARRFS
jgi:hypothetical protein